MIRWGSKRAAFTESGVNFEFDSIRLRVIKGFDNENC